MKQDNEKLRTIAHKVLINAGLQNDEKFGSVLAILMIISLILTSIRILQECNKNKLKNSTSQEKYSVYGSQIREFSKNRGWFTRMRIKRLLKRELNPEEYEKYGLNLLESLLNIGENLTDEEVITLVEAANV